MTEWERIGDVPVEAGCVLVLDPSSLRDVLFEGNKQVEDWYNGLIPGIASSDAFRVPSASSTAAIDVGCIVSSGYGDGLYPVEIRRAADGRVAEMRIAFIDADD